MIGSSLADIAIVTTLATRGWLMAPVHVWLVATLLGLSLVYLIGADLVKIRALALYRLR